MSHTRTLAYVARSAEEREAILRELGYPDEAEEETTSGLVLATVSTAHEDRMGDVIDQQSWNLEHYRRNPVILWGHDGSIPPIGRAEQVAVVDGSLRMAIRFDEGSDLGREIAHKYREGFLHAFSVGFVPREAIRRSELPEDHPAKGERGYFFRSNELLENSAVSIPANPHALAASYSRDDDRARLRDLVVEVVTEAMQGDALERALEVRELAKPAEPTDWWEALE